MSTVPTETELKLIKNEIESQQNAVSYDKETDLYTTQLVYKYKTVNLYLFYLFYIVLFILIGLWLSRNFQTLTSVRPFLLFIGVVGVGILYPLWSHLLVSYGVQGIKFIWTNIRNFFS